MELDLIHEQLISEENVNVNDLPESIKAKIKGFNVLNNRLKNNPENVAVFNSVQRNSISIADEIQNWLETDFEDEDDEEDDVNNKATSDAPKKNNTPAPATASALKGDKHSTPVIPNSNPTETAPKRFGNLVMEKKILSAISSNGGRIDSKTLTTIILKEPSYPTQIVHNIVLKKVFLSSSYILA